jgi:hypothetical protein
MFHVREKDKQCTFISLIYSNYIILYMFRTNKFIIRRLFLCTQHTVFLMHLWNVQRVSGWIPHRYMRNTVCCLYINNLLVMNLVVRNMQGINVSQ